MAAVPHVMARAVPVMARAALVMAGLVPATSLPSCHVSMSAKEVAGATRPTITAWKPLADPRGHVRQWSISIRENTRRMDRDTLNRDFREAVKEYLT